MEMAALNVRAASKAAANEISFSSKIKNQKATQEQDLLINWIQIYLGSQSNPLVLLLV